MAKYFCALTILNIIFSFSTADQFGPLFERIVSLDTKDIYYSKYFKSDIAHARSVCKTYGMDLMTLDSESDYQNFMDTIRRNSTKLIDEWYTMGAITTAIGTKDNWEFVNGGQKISYEIKWAGNEPDGNKNNLCLTMQKANRFIFYDSPCFGWIDYGFFCQVNIREIYLEVPSRTPNAVPDTNQ